MGLTKIPKVPGMPSIYYLPDEREIETNADETILQISLRSDIPHTHACRGKAQCSTCRVVILEGLEYCTPRNAKERALAERLHFSPEMRLSCQTKVTGNVKLRRMVLDDEDLALTSQLPKEMTLGYVGEEKQVAIMFADIRGSTAFSERLPPYDLIHVMNRYFLRMGKVINRYGGYIESYRGDGLMALFGVVEPIKAAWRAVKAGLGMLDSVEQLNPYLETMYKTSFQVVIGLHYGEVVVGAIGTPNMRQISAIGDAVIVASRIEDVCKEVNAKFLISEDMYNQVEKDVCVNRCLHVTLKGKSGEHRLYEVIGLSETNISMA